MMIMDNPLCKCHKIPMHKDRRWWRCAVEQNLYHVHYFSKKNNSLPKYTNSIEAKASGLAYYKLEQGCADCGYDYDPRVLEFDHRPGEEKLFNVGASVGLKWTRLLDEIEKCDVVCANCHRIRTSERNLSKKLLQF